MRIALLISGGGTTMEAIIKAARDGQLPKVHPALVISSSENAGGIEKAKNLGIKEENILITKPRGFEAEEDFGKAIISECRKRDVDFLPERGDRRKKGGFFC